MVHTATLRKLGGSAFLAIPPAFLESMQCAVGDEFELRLEKDVIEIRPKRSKLSLDQRLAMYKKALQHRMESEINEDKQWDAMPASGREAL